MRAASSNRVSQNVDPNPVDVHIGRRLRKRRKTLGITSVEAGLAIGVSFRQLQRFERGTERIGGERLAAFSELLNVAPAYFFCGISEANLRKTWSGSA